MAGPLQANVILARCSKTKKLFGIRVERRGGGWVRNWAFALDEYKAKHEGFSSENISGSIKAADEYPGCPHCGSKGFSHHGLMGCGKIACTGGNIDNGDGSSDLTCPWCGETATYSAASSFNVSGGGY